MKERTDRHNQKHDAQNRKPENTISPKIGQTKNSEETGKHNFPKLGKTVNRSRNTTVNRDKTGNCLHTAYREKSCLPHLPVSGSPRARQRYHKAVGRHALAALCIASLNFLSLSFASPAKFDQVCDWFLNDCFSLPVAQTGHLFPARAVEPSAAQARALSFVSSCVSRFASRPGAVSSVRDGPAGSQSPHVPSSHYSSLTDAAWLVADKVSLPESAASADLLWSVR